jgi:hypothetical protein
MKGQRVIFRKWKGNGDVIAFFLDQKDGPYVMSYEHVGQHGRATYPNPQTLPAKPDEYAPLLSELKRIGYDDLRVVTRTRQTAKDEALRYVKAIHDILSDVLENPEADASDIRDTAVRMCAALERAGL